MPYPSFLINLVVRPVLFVNIICFPFFRQLTLQRIFDELSAHQSRHHHGLGFDSAAAEATTAASADSAPAPEAAPAAAAAVPTSAIDAAAAIAARLSEQLKAQAAAAAAPAASAAPEADAAAPAAAPSEFGGLEHITDPIARARAMAARLASTISLGAGTSSSGVGMKRPRPEDGDAASAGAARPAPGASGVPVKRKKVYLPGGADAAVNWPGVFIGKAGAMQRVLEARTGAKVVLRGRGMRSSGGDPAEDADELHVVIAADDDEQLARAEAVVGELIAHPEAARAMAAADEAAGGAGSAAAGAGAGAGGFPSGIPPPPPNLSSLVAALAGAGGGGGAGAPSSTGYVSGFSSGPAPGAGGAGAYGVVAASSVASAPGAVTDILPIPTGMVGWVIGKGGENIRDIQARTGASVQVQRESEMLPGETERKVSIAGQPGSVAAAKAIISTMIETRRAELAAGGGMGGGGGGMGGGGMGGPERVTAQVPDDRVGIIIGRQGATIKAIQGRFGVHVNVSTSADS